MKSEQKLFVVNSE